jgi:lipid-binding SYLF domain-containing protein
LASVGGQGDGVQAGVIVAIMPENGWVTAVAVKLMLLTAGGMATVIPDGKLCADAAPASRINAMARRDIIAGSP